MAGLPSSSAFPPTASEGVAKGGTGDIFAASLVFLFLLSFITLFFLAVAFLFVVVRRDATMFRPNAEACPSFARYLGEARRAGVRVLAHRVKWSDDGDAESMGPLAVEL